MRSGFPSCAMGTRSVHVAADVDGAQAQAVTGLNHLLLIAVADAGVDVKAADAETVTPTTVMSPAAMEAMGGSGSNSSNAERGRGDQSESNLAKHYLISSRVGAKPLLCPCPSVEPASSCVQMDAELSCFRNVSSGSDKRHKGTAGVRSGAAGRPIQEFRSRSPQQRLRYHRDAGRKPGRGHPYRNADMG